MNYGVVIFKAEGGSDKVTEEIIATVKSKLGKLSLFFSHECTNKLTY